MQFPSVGVVLAWAANLAVETFGEPARSPIVVAIETDADVDCSTSGERCKSPRPERTDVSPFMVTLGSTWTDCVLDKH